MIKYLFNIPVQSISVCYDLCIKSQNAQVKTN